VSDRWWRVVFAAPPGTADAIAGMIVAATGSGVEELADGALTTTLESEAAARDLIDRVAQHFPGASAICSATASIDWSTRWRDGIMTRRFGRLLLTPSWLPVAPTAGDVVITIDPESAFGSGEHGSTRGALALLERHLQRGDRVLDLGSGSGILSIAAVALGARSAIGFEIDEPSIPVADTNARRNGVDGAISFISGDAADLAPLAGPVEVVCSNILRTVNVVLLPAIAAALIPGGIAIFAGMEAPEAPLFEPVLAAGGFDSLDTVIDDGWWSVAAKRR
jgi:ribosomal protein L11 methyltransferase